MVLRATLEKKQDKERVRGALLRAALRLGAVHGFASVGLREVAREAGIAPTSFYRHFADMEELGLALIRELAGHVLRVLGERAVAAPPGEVVSVLVDAMLAAVAQDPELMRFMVAERAGAFEGFRALLRGELAVLAHSLHGACTSDGQGRSSLPAAAAEAAVSLLFDAAARALDEPPPRRAALREPLIWSMKQLFGPDASRAASEGGSP
jgi:TetR/AcrR family transcriptional regulator, fatty acid biosynthesis regulator